MVSRQSSGGPHHSPLVERALPSALTRATDAIRRMPRTSGWPLEGHAVPLHSNSATARVQVRLERSRVALLTAEVLLHFDRLVLFDMFPQTAHSETVAAMRRMQPSSA